MKRFIMGAAMTAFATAGHADEVVFKDLGISAGEVSAKFQLMDEGLVVSIKGDGFFYDTFNVACRTLVDGDNGIMEGANEIIDSLPDVYSIEEVGPVMESAIDAAVVASRACVLSAPKLAR